jgi:hypothetical protein
MVHSFFGPSTHTTICFFMQEYMSVLVVTNHHAGLISWPVGPTERWTLKLSCKSEHTRGREGTPGGAKHAWRLLCLQSGSAGALANIPIGEEDTKPVAHFTKACILSDCQQLPQSSRLMQSWALIVFLTSICITVWLYPSTICKYVGPGCTDALPIDGVHFLYYPLFLAFYS